ncbi:metalloregulator ArsR/SmtB family transcription factor [Roseomonas sp. E05]|uniref:ArsR/SmtB family transcription factor n=1 Tax=Roseomonas sp. E05 TaxID=3046310 RepID=UPI0024BA7EA1|nr:metalloregulator ArsR/SmtB family transcription factor [Roseomonas sp. E05]MDJ0391128.1 metalloregulator ArsR/SmtB family transcription factor [Roseomonas sp. E05]
MIPDTTGIAEAAALLRVLANPARLRIALHLLGGERSVGQLEEELELKQPNLSQHLGELRDAGLLVARRESRAVFYQVAPGRPRHLLASLLHGLGGAAPAPVPPAPRPPRHPVAAASFAVVRVAR